jgi:hypothetical protein
MLTRIFFSFPRQSRLISTLHYGPVNRLSELHLLFTGKIQNMSETTFHDLNIIKSPYRPAMISNTNRNEEIGYSEFVFADFADVSRHYLVGRSHVNTWSANFAGRSFTF